jgi:hypothetical protein
MDCVCRNNYLFEHVVLSPIYPPTTGREMRQGVGLAP